MPPLATGNRGQIYLLPPYAASLQEDPFAHFHILLGTEPALGEAVLFFGTSSSTSCEAGAPCFAVHPLTSGLVSSGVSHLTHFCLSALVRAATTKVFQRRGTLPTAWTQELTDRTHEGLGTLSGISSQQRRYPNSRRGNLIRFGDTAKQHFHTRFGVLLTPHQYFAKEQYDVVLPLYDSRRRQVQPQPDWLLIPAPWGPVITGRHETTGFYAVGNAVTSVRRERHIENIFAQTLRPEEVSQIEGVVASFLNISPYAGASAALSRCPMQV